MNTKQMYKLVEGFEKLRQILETLTPDEIKIYDQIVKEHNDTRWK